MRRSPRPIDRRRAPRRVPVKFTPRCAWCGTVLTNPNDPFCDSTCATAFARERSDDD